MKSKQAFIAPSVGPEGATLKFTVTATGPCGTLSDTTTITITDVKNTNQPPVAQATVSPAPAKEGETVILDGSGSFDPEKGGLTYKWEQMSGTLVALDASSSAIATFTAPGDAYPKGESLVFRLTVSDGSLESSTTVTANITWVNDPPQGSITACPPTVKEGDTVTLTGIGYTTDDPITVYAWSQVTGIPNADLTDVNLHQSSISFKAPSLTALPPYHMMTFGFAVTDQGGLSSEQAKCFIAVLDITKPVIKCDTADGHWHRGNVSIHCTASDLGSGLANTADNDFYLWTSVADNEETANAPRTPSRCATRQQPRTAKRPVLSSATRSITSRL